MVSTRRPFSFTPLASERQHDQTIKIDQVINTRNTVYGRVVWGRDDSICDIVNSGQPIFPGGPCLVNTLRGPRNFAINWRFTPSAHVTNELVVGENRYDPIFGQPSSLDKVSIATAPVDTTWQYYFGNSRVVSTWQFVDNLAYFRGAHAFKFGFNLRRVREEDHARLGGRPERGRRGEFRPQHQHGRSRHLRAAIRSEHHLRPAQLPVRYQFHAGPRGADRPRLREPRRPVDQEHVPVRHALPGIRVLRARHVESAAQSDGGSGAAVGTPPFAQHAAKATS